MAALLILPVLLAAVVPQLPQSRGDTPERFRRYEQVANEMRSTLITSCWRSVASVKETLCRLNCAAHQGRDVERQIKKAEKLLASCEEELRVLMAEPPFRLPGLERAEPSAPPDRGGR